jgi:hypothetical protein
VLPGLEKAATKPAVERAGVPDDLRSASFAALPFLIFAAAFGLGTLLVLLKAAPWWAPTVVVIAYAFALFANRRNVPLTGEIKDSAYYLGFSFNLVFLLTAFRNYGPQAADANQTAVEYLIRALGSAIAATISGLIARYALYVLDDEELVQKKVFAELQDEIKKSVSGFRQNQRALIQGINGFLETRRRLAEQEEQASRNYLDNIESLLETLKTLQTTHVETVTQSIKSLEPAAELSLRQLRHINEEFGKLREGLVVADLAKTFNEVRNSISGFDSSTQSAKARLESVAQAAELARTRLTQIGEGAPGIAADLNAIDTILSDFVEILRQRVAALS